MSADPTFIAKNGKSRTYWVKKFLCLYNSHYNVYFLNNETTHKVRCGEVYYKGDLKTDGEKWWTVKDFDYELANSHFWVETEDGKVIDWIASFFMKRDTGVDKKVWSKAELEAHGIKHTYYDHEADILKRGYELYGDASDDDRHQ